MAEPTPQDKTGRLRYYNRITAFETVMIAAGVVLFLVMLYEMAVPSGESVFLNPPLIAIAGVILLWPLRRHQAAQALMFSGGFLLLIWFLDKLSGVLIPFVLVYLLAYLFNPLVSTLRERYNVARWISSLVVTLIALGVVTLIVLLVVPNIVSELRTLADRVIASVGSLHDWLETTTIFDRLEETGLMSKDEINRRLNAFAQEQTQRLAAGIPNAAQGVIQSIGSLLGFITTVAVIPVVLFYTLKDYPFIHQRLIELFPTFGGRRDYLIHAGGIVGNYLRGQLIISAIGAVVVSTALTILNVPFGLLIGLLAGLLNMIPNLGAIITMIFGVLIAVIFGQPWYWDVIKVVAVLLGQGLLEQSVLTPNILSHHVGLHPVLILLSLFVFGYFMGIFGLLIAVPATAIIMTIYKSYRDDLNLELSDIDPKARPRTPLMRRSRRRRPDADGTSETPAPETTPKDQKDD